MRKGERKKSVLNFLDSFINEINITCLIVIAGLHPLSSFKIDKQTLPEVKIFGWKIGGVNLPLILFIYFLYYFFGERNCLTFWWFTRIII